MSEKSSEKKQSKKSKVPMDLTKVQMPHTYAIIFLVILFLWIVTFIVPAGKFDTHNVEYTDPNGNVKTKTVLIPESFRYQYNLDTSKLQPELSKLDANDAKLQELGIDKAALDAFV